ncbi:MAG: site-specific integrase [bacterium]|nr:site-specific integrase [bacterium]
MTETEPKKLDFNNSAPTTSPTRARKLHLGHFAFMRAVVQGLDAQSSWNRYLRLDGDYSDLRITKKTIAWIRDEFAAAARRYDRHGTARLVLMDATTISDKSGELQSLDEFVVEMGLEDFSETEQIEAYQEKFGNKTQQQSRRAKLISKQLEALKWLEELVAQPPLSGDAIASWFNPDLVTHLEAADIFTVRALVERINGSGLRWWSGIKAIGALKAKRIVEWLSVHEVTIGLRIGTHTLVQRSKLQPEELDRVVARKTGIVPLEKFVMPAELNGTDGMYRAPQRLCLMRADNDYDAILTWLKSKHGPSEAVIAKKKASSSSQKMDPSNPLAWLSSLSNTQRAYKKEAERFLLWAIVQHKKPLSSMTLEDCESYREFLANPAPADRWCGPRWREKWSPLWRPFEGPLAPRAQRQSVTILKSMYRFLVDQCYLIGNPWNGVLTPKSNQKINKGHSFSRSQWKFINEYLYTLPDHSANIRISFAIHFLYATGLRLSEAVMSKVDHLNWMSYPADEESDGVEGWELTVIGKGDKERTIPIPIEIVAELSQYLESRGLDSDPTDPSNVGVFLFGKTTDVAERAPWSPKSTLDVDPKSGIVASTLADQLKRFFANCSDAMMLVDPQSASKLASASTHWMRHTHGSHSLASGMPLEILQQNLGHASLNTTTVYSSSEESRRMKEVQKFWQKNRTGS